ncbi:MAG: major capsid protein, partial [Bacilli bacterium]
LERMRMQALTTGNITIASNGQGYSYDYGMPLENKKEVAVSWSTATADIIGELNSYKEFMKAKGTNITRGVCNSTVAKTFLTNTAMKNAIYVFAGGTVNLNINTALSFIEANTGISIYVNDEVYVNEDKTVSKYVPDNTLSLFPDGDLGYTHFGTTPEEADLMSSAIANVSLVENAIAITTTKETDPVNVVTKVSMVALPSFERANEVMIIDTVK